MYNLKIKMKIFISALFTLCFLAGKSQTNLEKSYMINKSKYTVDSVLQSNGFIYDTKTKQYIKSVNSGGINYFNFIAIPTYTNNKLSGLWVKSTKLNFAYFQQGLLKDSFTLVRESKDVPYPYPLAGLSYDYTNASLNVTCRIICPNDMDETGEIIVTYREATSKEIERVKNNILLIE